MEKVQKFSSILMFEHFVKIRGENSKFSSILMFEYFVKIYGEN